MKTKNSYTKPETEVITLEIESPIMQASVTRDNVNPHTGAAGSRERNFWTD